MELSLNLNHRKIVEIRNCCSFNYMSNSNILQLFFNKEIDREMVNKELERLGCKIQKYDNSDYPDLPECYKLIVLIECPIVLRSND